MAAHITRWHFGALALVIALAVPSAHADDETVIYLRPRALPADIAPRVALPLCGGWTGVYGPIDYRTARPSTRRRVEIYHFDDWMPRFLTWIRGRPFDKYIGQNLGYTLRAFPNHPAALSAMEQIGRRLGSDDIPGSYYPLECWFTRALQTVPDDPLVRAQYGIYLAFRGRGEESRLQLAAGDTGACLNAALQYQIGLARLKLGDFALAQRNALRAERLQPRFDGLKRQLIEQGKWDNSMTLPDQPPMDCKTDDPDAPERPASASTS